MPFDVRSLLTSDFPWALCPKCCSILPPLPSESFFKKPKDMDISCLVCGVKYKTEKDQWDSFFKYHDGYVRMEDPLKQAKSLVLAVRSFEGERYNISPIQLLFSLLSRSSKFVHFATWNISNDMLGALAMLASRIPVRGIIGGINAQQVDLITAFQKEIDGFELNIFGDRTTFQGPHQKLLVFDGLVAIEGSANLSLNAWMKASDYRESLRVITEIDEVRKINNSYFSRHFRAREWADHEEITDLWF